MKVRGFRIELGEIETALSEHTAVDRAAVVVKEIRPGDSRLIAFIVTNAGKNVTVTELREHMRNKLPEYMIPNHIMELEALPLTPAGKIVRKLFALTESALGIEAATLHVLDIQICVQLPDTSRQLHQQPGEKLRSDLSPILGDHVRTVQPTPSEFFIVLAPHRTH